MAEDDGCFRPLEELPGRIFVPRGHGARKHPCPECFECQWCADVRCCACRGSAEAGEPCGSGGEERQATNK